MQMGGKWQVEKKPEEKRQTVKTSVSARSFEYLATTTHQQLVYGE